MIELGQSLRAAREARGYTIKQLADLTKMAPSKIEDLENEDFSHIAAPIYGRGFVKLYCEAVGLDPKPHVAEFMEIMNGNREPEIKTREVCEPAPVDSDSEPAPPESAEPAVPATEPESTLQPCLEEPPPLREPFRLVSEVQPATPPRPEVPAQPEEQRPFLSRYSVPAQTARAVFSSSYLRLGLLTAGAALMVLLLFCGIRALYRATAPSQAAPAAQEEVTAQAQTHVQVSETSVSTPPKARTPQEISPLYVD